MNQFADRQERGSELPNIHEAALYSIAIERERKAIIGHENIVPCLCFEKFSDLADVMQCLQLIKFRFGANPTRTKAIQNQDERPEQSGRFALGSDLL